MTALTSLFLFKLVFICGLALWLAVVSINNLTAFRGGVASVGALMGMQMFDQAPAIDTPLLKRRVVSPGWHRLVYGFVVAIELAVVILLGYAALGFVGAMFGTLDVADAILRANLALIGFVAMGFVMLLGGAWFAYYIRQEGMQITHLVLIGVGMIGALVINAPV